MTHSSTPSNKQKWKNADNDEDEAWENVKPGEDVIFATVQFADIATW